MIRYQYHVNGLANTQMKTQVKNLLDDLDGVNKVNVDLKRGEIAVECQNTVRDDQIRSRIEQVGCRIE